MKSKMLAAALLAVGLAGPALAEVQPPFTLRLSPLGTYHSGLFDQAAAEIVAHDPLGQRLFVVNAASGRVDVLDIRDPAAPALLSSIDLSAPRRGGEQRRAARRTGGGGGGGAQQD